MVKTRLFKKTFADELLKIARDDLETAKALENSKISRKENILFHVQQSIEKALKAYTCHLQIPTPLVHDLSEILHVIPNAESIPHSEDIYDLTQFATIRRYEDGVAVITDEEISAAIKAAEQILKDIQQKINHKT